MHDEPREWESDVKDITEIRRWATLRCAHCGHRFRWARDARHSFGNRDGKVYHGPCIDAIVWRRKADERLQVVAMLSDLSGLGDKDLQTVAELRATDAPGESTAANLVWRVFYDLSKRVGTHPTEP